MSKKKIVSLKKLNRKDVTIEIDGINFVVPDMNLDLEFDFDRIFSKLVSKIDLEKSIKDDTGLSAWTDIMDNTTDDEIKKLGRFAIEEINGCEDYSIMEAFSVLYVYALEFNALKVELKKK